MRINLQSLLISSLNSEKHNWLSNKRKEIMLESISMAGTCRGLFKPCHHCINVYSIFRLLLVNFLDLQMI